MCILPKDPIRGGDFLGVTRADNTPQVIQKLSSNG
jgi:hypothetical protein